MRLPARPGERLDRDRGGDASRSTGKPVRAFEGDTIGSALYAAGQRVFSRSFKYHRPRGLLCCSGQLRELHDDGGRRAQRPRLRRARPRGRGSCGRRTCWARSSATCSRHRQGRRPVHPGRLLLPDDDPAALGVAALREGAAQRRRPRQARQARQRARTATTSSTGAREVLVVGGGAGRAVEAARGEHAAAGPSQVRRSSTSGFAATPAGGDGVEVVSPGARDRDLRGRARAGRRRHRSSTATAPSGSSSPRARSSSRSSSRGTTSSGVMLPDGVRRLDRGLGASSRARRAVVVDRRTMRGLEAAEPRSARPASSRRASIDLRRERSREIVARGRKRRRSARSRSTGASSTATSLVMSGRAPARLLAARAGGRAGRVRPRRAASSSRPTSRTGIEAVGSVAGEGTRGAVPAASYNGASGKGKCFVCVCEDVDRQGPEARDRARASTRSSSRSATRR